MDISTDHERQHRPGQNGAAAPPEQDPADFPPDPADFRFAANPGRRSGERWAVKMPHASDAKRLYGRATLENPPDPNNLRDTYADALALMERFRPLRAARMDDLIGRVEYTFQRYRATKREEESRHQNTNEEARSANDWIDNRVGLLRTERARTAEPHDLELAQRRDTLAECNEEAAAAQTASGNPMPYRYRGTEDDNTTAPPDAAPPIAAAASAAIQAAAALPAARAQAAAGLLSRLRGGLNLGLRANVPVPAQVDPATQTAPINSTPPRPPRRAYAPTVPFPLADGLEQATPLEAIAMQQGLPYRSPLAHAMESKQHWIEWLALLACGSIFGASIGFLTRLLKLTDFSLHLQQTEGKLAALCVLGVFMFWLLGRVVFAAAAMASEDRHLHLTASHRDSPDAVGKWLHRASIVALILLPLIGGVLVTIEAVVERYGIVSTFADSQQNNAIASGLRNAQSGGINPIALIFMVLTISLPFVLLHMAHGWADARAKVFAQYLDGRRQLQAWEIAKACHAQRVAATADLFAKECAEDEDARAKEREETDRLTREANLAQAQAAADAHAHSAPPDTSPAGADAQAFAELAPGMGEPIPAAAPIAAEPTMSKEDIARTLARAWEAEQRWRRTRRERTEALAWYDERIKAYESERQKENPQPDQLIKQHIDHAHSQYVAALKHFEDTYLREIRQVERMMQAGLLVRLWLALMRQPYQAPQDIHSPRLPRPRRD